MNNTFLQISLLSNKDDRIVSAEEASMVRLHMYKLGADEEFMRIV